MSATKRADVQSCSEVEHDDTAVGALRAVQNFTRVPGRRIANRSNEVSGETCEEIPRRVGQDAAKLVERKYDSSFQRRQQRNQCFSGRGIRIRGCWDDPTWTGHGRRSGSSEDTAFGAKRLKWCETPDLAGFRGCGPTWRRRAWTPIVWTGVCPGLDKFKWLRKRWGNEGPGHQMGARLVISETGFSTPRTFFTFYPGRLVVGMRHTAQ
ncbi:hypothetical protein DFH09DRAFT_1094590 [Mycena vulgaris]|nr:hypothetical protein DFH09DRAFT_1094590 [Mycena vulgaris]